MGAEDFRGGVILNFMEWERDVLQELKLLEVGSDIVCPGCSRRIVLGEVFWKSLVCACGEKMINGEVEEKEKHLWTSR